MISAVLKRFSPITENASTTAPSRISMRRCIARVARRPAPALLFLRVAYQRENFPDHHKPAIRKKLPGRIWPLKLPMVLHGNPGGKQNIK